MSKLRAKFTLPELQEQLDNLAEGALLQISGWDYERLFGINDVAATRLRNLRRRTRALQVTATRRSCFARSSRGGKATSPPLLVRRLEIKRSASVNIASIGRGR